jgi:AbrB family looped-hinge helix DNA binding protein
MANTKTRHRTKVGKRNQVTIPASMLRELGVGPGQSVELEMVGRQVVVRNAMDAIDRAYGILKRMGVQPLTGDELTTIEREAHAARVARREERDARTRGA